MHSFLQNLAFILLVAAFTTVVFHKLKQPVILGYLLAGLLIGPHLPLALISNPEDVHTFAELGVILIMFSLGLKFSIRRLIRVIPISGFIGLFECSLMIWLGYIAGQLFGWTILESIYAGCIVAISSTTIIVKAFGEQNLKSKFTETVYGILIVEDLIAILLLAILPTQTAHGEAFLNTIFESTGYLSLFIIFVLVSGMLVVPRFMRFVIRIRRPETTLVASIGLCFGFALLAKSAGYSVALGAFIAGSLVAESGEDKQIGILIAPVRDMFGAVFFVAVGMLIDPSLIVLYKYEILAFVALVTFGKIISVSMGTFLTGHSTTHSLRAGMSLAQIGEFSFIIAGLGLQTGATGSFLYPIAVAVSAFTTLLTPWLIKFSAPVSNHIENFMPRTLLTFTSLYCTWIQQLRDVSLKGQSRSRWRKLLGMIIGDTLILTVIIIGAALLTPKLIIMAQFHLKLSILLLQGIAVVFTLLISSPFCLGLIRCIKKIGLIFALEIMPEGNPQSLDRAAAPRRMFIVTVQFMVLSLVGLFLLAVTQPFLPIQFNVTVFVIAFIALFINFWRSAENLQGHVKAGAQMVLEVLSPNKETPASQERILEELLPGLGTITQILITNNSPVVGKTLAEIHLGALTGALVVAIIRKPEGIVSPQGTVQLKIDDILALAGTKEAILHAEALLT